MPLDLLDSFSNLPLAAAMLRKNIVDALISIGTEYEQAYCYNKEKTDE